MSFVLYYIVLHKSLKNTTAVVIHNNKHLHINGINPKAFAMSYTRLVLNDKAHPSAMAMAHRKKLLKAYAEYCNNRHVYLLYKVTGQTSDVPSAKVYAAYAQLDGGNPVVYINIRINKPCNDLQQQLLGLYYIAALKTRDKLTPMLQQRDTIVTYDNKQRVFNSIVSEQLRRYCKSSDDKDAYSILVKQ